MNTKRKERKMENRKHTRYQSEFTSFFFSLAVIPYDQDEQQLQEVGVVVCQSWR